MRSRRIALFICSVALSACASSERRDSGVRFVKDPVALGCTKVGILAWGSPDGGGANFSDDVSPGLRAQVINLGGNAIGGSGGLRHPYTEVWSCPGEEAVAPR